MRRLLLLVLTLLSLAVPASASAVNTVLVPDFSSDAADATNVDRLTHVLYTPQLAQSNADAALFLVLKPFDPKDKTPDTTAPAGSTTSSTDPSKALTLP